MNVLFFVFVPRIWHNYFNHSNWNFRKKIFHRKIVSQIIFLFDSLIVFGVICIRIVSIHCYVYFKSLLSQFLAYFWNVLWCRSKFSFIFILVFDLCFGFSFSYNSGM